jgi:hypothetical protein
VYGLKHSMLRPQQLASPLSPFVPFPDNAARKSVSVRSCQRSLGSVTLGTAFQKMRGVWVCCRQSCFMLPAGGTLAAAKW